MKKQIIQSLTIFCLGLTACQNPQTDLPDDSQVASKASSPHAKSANSTHQAYHKASLIPERQTIGVPDSGVQLGMGWDSERGVVIPNTCLEFAPLRSTGQTIDMELSEVSDQSEMMEKMKVSAAVSARSAFASGSAKTDFAKSSKLTSESTTLLLRTTVDNSVLTIAPPAAHAPTRDAFPAVEPVTLSAGQIIGSDVSRQYRRNMEERSGIIGFRPELRSRLRDPDAFRQACGDYFVAAIHSGAEMFTTFTFSTKSRADKKAMSAAVKGSVGMYSGSIKGNSDSASMMSSSNLEMRFVQVGGGASMIPMSREDLSKKLAQLAIEADLTPKFHTMEIRSYREIPGAEELIYGSSDGALEVISDYYWFLSSFSDQIEHVLDNPSEYYDRSGLSDEKLSLLLDEIILTRRALADIIDSYLDGTVPAPDVLRAANVKWFDQDKENKFVLDFPEIGQVGEAASTLQHPCPENNWFDCVISEIESSVPYGNPNTLKLLLPMSESAFGIFEEVLSEDKDCMSHYMAQIRRIVGFKTLNKSTVGRFEEVIAETCKTVGTQTDPLKDSNKINDEEFKRFVLEHNIAEQSRRVCAREPRDNECLTHKEIADLAQYIPMNPNNP